MNIKKIKALFIYVGFLDKCKTILPFIPLGTFLQFGLSQADTIQPPDLFIHLIWMRVKDK